MVMQSLHISTKPAVMAPTPTANTCPGVQCSEMQAVSWLSESGSRFLSAPAPASGYSMFQPNDNISIYLFCQFLLLLEKYLTEYIHIEEGSKDLLFSSFGTIRSRSAYLPIWFSSLDDAQMLWGPSTHISLTTPGILETWNTRMRDALPLTQKSYFPWGEKPMTRKVFNKQKKQPHTLFFNSQLIKKQISHSEGNEN